MAPPTDSSASDMPADEQASDDADAAALRDRVDALEQTVSEQQATIDALSSPPVSRRGVLAALTGVAGAGALGAYSQRGAAQAAGQVGTSSEPVDVEAWSLNVQDQLAGDLDAGGNDLTNVGAVEAGSLSTDKATIGPVPEGTSSNDWITWDDGIGEVGKTVKFTPVNANTTTTILPAPSRGLSNPTLMTQATVLGRTSGTEYFIEEVFWGAGTAPVVVDKAVRGNPGARTYSKDSEDLQLEMGVDVNIGVVATGLRVDAP